MAQIDDIRLRRGTAAAWALANPILGAGEPGLETDTRKLKFGDGVSTWNALLYATSSGEGGGGASIFTDLSDYASASIPTLNIPTANALAAKLDADSVVNDLTTGGTTVPGSAQQLVVLKGLIDAVGGAPAAADITDATTIGIAMMTAADAGAVVGALGLGSASLATVDAFEAAGSVSAHNASVSSVHGITAAAATVLDDTTVAAMVDTLGGAASTGTGGIARAISPTFTGTPAAPTAAAATNTTQIATTAHVFAERTNAATLTSKTMSGSSNTFSAIPQSAVTNLTTDLAAKYGSANVGVDIQAYDADLTTIGGLSPANDDILQRKSSVWTNRTVAQYFADLLAAGAIGTVSGTPTGGADGDFRIGKTKPEAGFLWLRTAGVWAGPDNSYTWATRPAAASYEGRIITITDIGNLPIDFYSDGTNWIPVGNRLHFGSITPTTNYTGSAGVESGTLATDTFPAGLILPGCQVRLKIYNRFTLTNGTKTFRAKLEGTNILVMLTDNAARLAQRINGYFDVVSTTAIEGITFSASATGYSIGTGQLSPLPTVDFTGATSLTYTLETANASDGAIVSNRLIEVLYR